MPRRLMFVQLKTGYWVSGPKRDRSDLRYGPGSPHVDEDARQAYQAFPGGAPLPGCGSG
jgi:hypothetical protein